MKPVSNEAEMSTCETEANKNILNCVQAEFMREQKIMFTERRLTW